MSSDVYATAEALSRLSTQAAGEVEELVRAREIARVAMAKAAQAGAEGLVARKVEQIKRINARLAELLPSQGRLL